MLSTRRFPSTTLRGMITFSLRRRDFPESVYEWWAQQPHTAWGGAFITSPDLNRFVAAASQDPVWVVSYESAYYDPHQALVERLSHMGRATEVPLPSDPEVQASESDPGLRLIGVSLR